MGSALGGGHAAIIGRLVGRFDPPSPNAAAARPGRVPDADQGPVEVTSGIRTARVNTIRETHQTCGAPGDRGLRPQRPRRDATNRKPVVSELANAVPVPESRCRPSANRVRVRITCRDISPRQRLFRRHPQPIPSRQTASADCPPSPRRIGRCRAATSGRWPFRHRRTRDASYRSRKLTSAPPVVRDRLEPLPKGSLVKPFQRRAPADPPDPKFAPDRSWRRTVEQG